MSPPHPSPGACAHRLPRQAVGGVAFTFESGPDTKTVAVAGTFNSWVGDSCPLQRSGPGTWQATLPIAPGRHLYKYVVDGEQWIPDPANPWISEDGQNNSCFTVNEMGEALIRRGDVGPQAPGDLYRRHAALQSPDWLRDAVVYQLSVQAFGGSFAAVRERLDYLGELGVNVVWMMPIHPIGIARRCGTQGDPYAVRDFTAIDPALGDEAALQGLVDDLHGRGMRIVMDWTLNRSSCDHPLTQTHPHWFTRDANGLPCYLVPQREYFAGFDFTDRALRRTLIDAMSDWVRRVGFDGLRFDDSDITPLDFLREIRTALAQLRPDIGLISQSYDELHHLDSCDLTYEGGTRELIHQVALGEASALDFQRYWEASTYSFPRGALRMRWLEDKEQGRAFRLYGRGLHQAAAAIQVTLDGVPHILMGQEFNEPRWTGWACLFDDFTLDWASFDDDTFRHYQSLLRLRQQHAALRQGRVEFIAGLPQGVIGYWRGEAAERVRVIVNLSAASVTLPCEATPLHTLYAKGLSASATHDQVLAALGCWIAMPV